MLKKIKKIFSGSDDAKQSDTKINITINNINNQQETKKMNGDLSNKFQVYIESLNDKVSPTIIKKLNELLEEVQKVENYFSTDIVTHSEELFEVQKIIEIAIPNSINSYLKIPKAEANSLIVKDGKTAKEIVCDHIEQGRKYLFSINEEIVQRGVDELLSNDNYINNLLNKNKL